ncbi:MAG: cytochrome c maturation protein CcmE [Chloroflexota bacterium]|nr:cytochrome c maturation protein CcmE [Chloroflexota bacterium]
MAQAVWEKPAGEAQAPVVSRERLKFLIGGILILGAILYLIFSGMQAGARFFITVDEVVNDANYAGQTVRVSGAVLGDTIRYDEATLTIEFTVVHIPEGQDVTGETLFNAVNDPNATQMRVRVEGQTKPDLLRHEAQAIMTGTYGADGVFHVSELNLKCPSRFIEGAPGEMTEAGS